MKINAFNNYIFPPNTLLGRMEKKALNSDLRPAIFLAIYLDPLSISFLYIVCRFIVKTEVICEIYVNYFSISILYSSSIPEF